MKISKKKISYQKKIEKYFKQKIANVYNEFELNKVKPLFQSTNLYFPNEYEKESFVVPKSKAEFEVCEQGLPIPPKNLWLGYGENTEGYLKGKIQISNLLKILSDSGFELEGNKRVLDFGCGAGRMVRWLKPFSEKCELWGVDISSEHIFWANANLNPPINFATTTIVPHLPFEDKYFDLIYAGSVFTHIDDLAISWLLELRRLITNEGRIYITVQDKHSLELMNKFKIWKESWISTYINQNELYQKSKNDFNVFVGLRGPESQVFYDIDYFCDSIKTFYDVISVTKEAYGFQTGVLLKKKFKK